MKIVLYNPVSSADKKPVLPMSLLALGALLEGRHTYTILDGNLERDPAEALDAAIRQTDAQVLGVTVMPGPQLADAVPICRAMRKRHPDLTIVWGGYFPTEHHEACIRSDCVDHVVRGYGERVFLDLLDQLERHADPSNTASIAGRSPGNSQAFSTGLAPMPHPQELPAYPYHRVPMLRYIRPTFMGRRTLPHHSSYGCPFLCSFCGVVSLSHGRWLAESAQRTAGVARAYVDRWQADAIEFYDNNFFVQESRIAEFSERVMDLKIGWWGEARIDTLLRYSDSTWRRMRDSGLKMVFLGVESGSDETLRRIDKGGTATVEKTLQIVEKMRCYGIIPECSFMLGSPPDPEMDTECTINFIRAVKNINPFCEIILYMYTPGAESGELYDHPGTTGFRFPETLDEWISRDWQEFARHRSVRLPWLKGSLGRRVREFERVLNAFYPTTTDRRLRGMQRLLLRGLGSWRYHLRVYRFPLELEFLQRLFRYQRPETSGF